MILLPAATLLALKKDEQDTKPIQDCTAPAASGSRPPMPSQTQGTKSGIGSVAKAKNPTATKERRYDGDTAYTLEEFLAHYGKDEGFQHWKAATRETQRPKKRRPPAADRARHQLKRKLLREIAKNKLPYTTVEVPNGKIWTPANSLSHYKGLVVARRECLRQIGVSEDLHQRVTAALESLLRLDAFKPTMIVKRDAHNRLERSAVYARRLLVGQPGVTHGSQNHRLFAVNWDCGQGGGIDDNATSSKLHRQVFGVINELRQELEHMISAQASGGKRDDAENDNPTSSHLSADEVLINYFPPPTTFSADAYLGLERCAMAWHRDKGLEENSNVFVYSCQPDMENTAPDSASAARDSESWRVAFKVAWDAKTPAVVVPVFDGDAYFMMGRFNETHQHAVFAGSRLFYNSCDVAHGSFALSALL